MHTLCTASLIGLTAVLVDVQVDVSPGIPQVTLVGLPDTCVQEARERVRSALRQSDLPFPRARVTINLAPGHVRKTGTGFDLPIATALLLAQGSLPALVTPCLVAGELSLSGQVLPIRGALSYALLAKDAGIRTLLLPAANAEEASLVSNIDVIPIASLQELFDHLNRTRPITPHQHTSPPPSSGSVYPDFREIRGQPEARRAMEIAAAGGHNILLSGSPGSGKTLLARSFPSILPPLSIDEQLEVTRIHSIAGLRTAELQTARPFRAPHHHASPASMTGGGSNPHPGEITLAHRGVLFLDEFPECPRVVLESLRQPLEDGLITVSRARERVTFPARFQLIAAMNPCPCGYAGDPLRPCTCSPRELHGYTKKLSGPLLDRLDLVVSVPRLDTQALLALEAQESSEIIAQRVALARERQTARWKRFGVHTNAELTTELIRAHIRFSDEARALFEKGAAHHHLTGRGCVRWIKVAQTIADLGGVDSLLPQHLAEALRFRQNAPSN